MQASLNCKISVIIPVYRGGENFRKCLNGLAEAVPPPDEIIIVADGGMEQTPYPDPALSAKIIETPIRSGPANARNRGASEALGDILFFVDADVVIHADAIRKIRSFFEEAPDVAALFGSYDDTPSESNFLSQYRNLLHHYVHQHGREDASTFWGACGAIRRDLFLKLDGFDDARYRHPAIEDIEFGYRLKKAGYTIRLCKTLQVTHLKHWDVLSILTTDFSQRALPWTELLLQHPEFMNDLNVDAKSRVSVFCVLGLLLTLIGAFWMPALLLLSLMLSLTLFGLNRSLYVFLRRKRGLFFACKALPWHWLYFFYSGLAFGIGLIRHQFNMSPQK
ncbi:glycosyl transferase [candidate division KSB3 bacterium]|uniref:Glycosyl transferase n=1 Tax=candidate division KSB3 bacterium TaxID=2044937 RepID=A0A2G6KAH5_9BACT|nr:MAG: glycosyl transferase [candidate division KSB3 bacterium]